MLSMGKEDNKSQKKKKLDGQITKLVQALHG